MNKKYYHRINNLDIDLEKTNHKYIMINEWSKDNTHRWGIAHFVYNEEYDYYELQGIGDRLNSNLIDWYDFGCLVKLGYKWIKENCFNDKEQE